MIPTVFNHPSFALGLVNIRVIVLFFKFYVINALFTIKVAINIGQALRKSLDNSKPAYYIRICKYKEIVNEIFSQSYEGSFRSESGKNR
jgi:hypothetical protein